MDAMIEVEGLSKTFTVRQTASGVLGAVRGLLVSRKHQVRAVSDVSFSIQQGERVAFVGPNGAGKSTTLKMLTGILYPSAGSARVGGMVPWQQRRRLAYRMGAVFGQRSQLWYHLPAHDTFELLCRIYDQDPAEYRRRRGALVEAFAIGPHLHKPVRQLSLGQRMRCEIVASLLHAPEVVFLDEPTIGLDVSAKATIRDLVREQSERDGRTIMLTSHDTGDMERVCERVIVIHEGRLLIDRSLSSLRSSYIRKKLLTVQSAQPRFDIDLPGVTVLSRAPHRTALEVDVSVTPVEAALSHLMKRLRVQDLTVEDPPMEDIVQDIYAGAEAVDCGSSPWSP